VSVVSKTSATRWLQRSNDSPEHRKSSSAYFAIRTSGTSAYEWHYHGPP